MSLGIYLHIPFCDRICLYCDFAKEVAHSDKKDRYLDALIQEMTFYKDSAKNATTLYIGGGTPTALSLSQLERLFKAVQTIFPGPFEEFTLEGNPNHITREMAELLALHGVNRVSLGAQTFNETQLKFLRRTHQVNDVYHAVDCLRAVGIENISIDCLFGLPNQSEEELRFDLEQLCALKVPHISYYGLILEEKTALYQWVEQRRVEMPDDAVQARHYERVITTLKAAGYEHYEISNFALEGRYSHHNLIYWRNLPYLGCGAGAHGRLENQRYANERSVKKYIEAVHLQKTGLAYRYPFKALEDTFLMGLRLHEGVYVPPLENTHGFNLLKRYPELDLLLKREWVTYRDGWLRLTEVGRYFGNEVFELFYGGDDDA